RSPPPPTLSPYTTLFRSPLDERVLALGRLDVALELRLGGLADIHERGSAQVRRRELRALTHGSSPAPRRPSVRSAPRAASSLSGDRKSTRLNSSHEWISY